MKRTKGKSRMEEMQVSQEVRSESFSKESVRKNSKPDQEHSQRREEEEDVRKLVVGLESVSLTKPLKRNISEMKLQEEKTFNSRVSDNDTGHVRSLVLGFERRLC